MESDFLFLFFYFGSVDGQHYNLKESLLLENITMLGFMTQTIILKHIRDARLCIINNHDWMFNLNFTKRILATNLPKFWQLNNSNGNVFSTQIKFLGISWQNTIYNYSNYYNTVFNTIHKNIDYKHTTILGTTNFPKGCLTFDCFYAIIHTILIVLK